MIRHGGRRWRALPRWVVLCAVAGAAAASVLWWLARPLSPDGVRATTIRALETGDAALLVRLADPQEVKRLHVTPQAVEGVLKASLWEHGPPKVARFEPLPGAKRVDGRTWDLYFVGDAPGDWRRKQPVVVVDTPKHGWRLLLTDMLRCACWRKMGGAAGTAEYWRLAAQNGITGVLTQRGNYVALYGRERAHL